MPKVTSIIPEKFLRNRNQFNFIIAHISEEEALKIIESLPNESTGPVSFPLNVAANMIVVPLCNIYQIIDKGMVDYPLIIRQDKKYLTRL